MAYNRRNLLTRIVDIQTITRQYTDNGVTQEYVYLNYIYPQYIISRRTYYTYLAINAKKELKQLNEAPIQLQLF